MLLLKIIFIFLETGYKDIQECQVSSSFVSGNQTGGVGFYLILNMWKRGKKL